MIKVNIDLGDRSYPIYITTDYSQLSKSMALAKLSGKLALITDNNVDIAQGNECIGALESNKLKVYKYVIEAGEKSKNLDTIRDIYKFLIDNKFDRSSVLVALGGGVVGDITGFVAATFLRGVNFVQIPTSLLAQADSSVGGKVGVDFEGKKNIIGAFYQPKFVYLNVNTLKTLPVREMQSGMAEIVKHGVIRDPDFYDFIDYNVSKIFNFDEDVLKYLAKVNCTIKGAVVEQDEKEGGLRAILNFGHTIGHAIESVYEFKYIHGECVSLGMVAALNMACDMEMIGNKEVSRVISTLKKIGLPVTLDQIDVDAVYGRMFFDKKVKDNKITFVLPKAIGEVIQCVVEDEVIIKKAIRSLQS
jgi:3-dehydroquinate synthase